MRILVCGSRDWKDMERLFKELDAFHAKTPITFLIHGAYRGVDRLAEVWALEREIPYCGWPARWKQVGPEAGPIRNQAMLDNMKPELVIAFPGNAGTADMITRAKKAGLKVHRIVDA